MTKLADISKITLPTGTTYDIKDVTARQMAAGGVSFTKCTSASNTPKDVTWDDDGTTITGTLEASSSTTGIFYLVPVTTQGGKDIYAEYATITSGSGSGATYSWEKIGTTDIDLSDLGDLAYKDAATGSFTPAGSVSTPTITVTPSTTTGYVAESATGGGSVSAGTAASATMPVFSTSVSDETLTLSWTPGSFTANTPTAVTLPSFSSQTIVDGITSATSSQPSFTGTEGTVDVS